MEAAAAGRNGHDLGVRSTIALAVLVAAGSAAIAVTASARDSAQGLPAYTNGYAGWPKINRRPFATPGAHSGVKNVYRSRRKIGRTYPNGTVIVKSIARPGTKGLPGQVAVMRKVGGRWRWVEYTRSGGTYSVLAQGSLCSSCHTQARANDWVFTKG